MTIKFVIDAEDRGCEDEELRDHGAVSCSNFVSVGDGQRDEGENDCGGKAGDSYKILYETRFLHEFLEKFSGTVEGAGEN